MRKGQLFSGDIAIASLVFLTALALVFFMWNSTAEDLNRAEELNDMAKLASETLEQLIRTPGVPEDWNKFEFSVLGIADDRVLNHTKVGYFIELMNSTNYETNLNRMGLGPYDFYMNVTDLQGDLLVVGGNDFVVGVSPVDDSYSLALFRTAVYNDTIVRLNFVMWR